MSHDDPGCLYADSAGNLARSGREDLRAFLIAEPEPPDSEGHGRVVCVESITAPGLMLTSLARRDADAPEDVVLSADLAATEQQNSRLESAVRTLSAEPVVSAIRWSTRNEAAVDWVGK